MLTCRPGRQGPRAGCSSSAAGPGWPGEPDCRSAPGTWWTEPAAATVSHSRPTAVDQSEPQQLKAIHSGTQRHTAVRSDPQVPIEDHSSPQQPTSPRRSTTANSDHGIQGESQRSANMQSAAQTAHTGQWRSRRHSVVLQGSTVQPPSRRVQTGRLVQT